MKTSSRSSVSRRSSSRCNKSKAKEVDGYRQLRNSIICAGEISSSEVSSHQAVCGSAWRPRSQAVWKVQYTPWDQPNSPYYVATIHPISNQSKNEGKGTASRDSRCRASSRLPTPKDTLASLLMLAELQYFVMKVQQKFGLEPLEPNPDETYYCEDRRREKIDVTPLLPELNVPGLAGILFHRMMMSTGQHTTTEIGSGGCWRVDPEEAYKVDIANWQGGPTEFVEQPPQQNHIVDKGSREKQRSKQAPASLAQGIKPLPTDKENVAAAVAGKKNGPVVSESDHSSDDEGKEHNNDSNNTASINPQTSVPPVPPSPSAPLTVAPPQQKKRNKKPLRGEDDSTSVSDSHRPGKCVPAPGLDPTPCVGQSHGYNQGHLHRDFYQASLPDIKHPQSPGRQHDHDLEVNDNNSTIYQEEGHCEHALSMENDRETQEGTSATDAQTVRAKRRNTLQIPTTDCPILDEPPCKKQKRNESNPSLNDATVDGSESANHEGSLANAGHPVRRSKRSRERTNYADMVDGLKHPKGTKTAGSSCESEEPSSSVRISQRLRTRTVHDSSNLRNETTQLVQAAEDPTSADQELPQKTRRSSRRASQQSHSTEPQTCRVRIRTNKRLLEMSLEAFMTSEGIPQRFVAQPKKYALRERAARSYSEDDSEPAFEEAIAAEDVLDVQYPPFVLSTSNQLSILKLVDEYDGVARKTDGAFYPLAAYGNEDSARNAVDTLLKDLDEANEKHPSDEVDEEILAEQQLHNRTMRLMTGRRSQEQSIRYKEREQAENQANLVRQQLWISKKKAPKIDDIEWEEIVERPIQFAATRTMRRARIHGSDSCPCRRKTTRNASRGGEEDADDVCRLCSGATNTDVETCVPNKSLMPFCVAIDTDSPEFLERDADPTEDDQTKEADLSEKKGTRASKRKKFDFRKRRDTIMKLSELKRSIEFAEQYNSGLLDKMTTAGV